MSVTPNQVNDIFQSSFNRPATDYEIKTYSTASPQVLASLKDSYAKLNMNSISDYLTSVGQDPSLENRTALGQKYGVPNIGSAEGNTALLTALKSGKPPTPAPVAPVGGSIVAPAPQASNQSNVPQNTAPTKGTVITTLPAGAVLVNGGDNQTVNAYKDPQGNQYLQNPDGTYTVDSVVSQSQPENQNNSTAQAGTIEADPNVSRARQVENDSYQTQQTLQKQIRDIDTAMSSAMQNKRDEIARSGGVVNESQLRSEVLTENAPLVAQRKELVSQYAQAKSAYQKATADKKDAEANYYKGATLALSQTKVANQSDQFSQKLEQAGWKSTKVNVYDEGGNIVGQRISWTQNPAATSTDNAMQTTVKTSSGKGGITSSGATNSGTVMSTNPPKISVTDGAPSDQVLNSLITGKPITVKGSTTPITQQTLYNLAIADMLGDTSTAGGRTPSGAVLAVKAKEADIMNAYGLTPVDIATAKQQFKGMSAANTKLLSTAAFNKVYLATATDNLNLALEQSVKVPRSGAKIVNNYTNWAKGNFTPSGDLAEFETYIYTAAREYAKVTSGGAMSASGLTDSAAKEASRKLLLL